MPEYLSPGVYVEEISTGPRPIEGVSTSTAAFVGLAERGPEWARLVTSWLDFQRWYGTYIPDLSYLAYAVQGFFDNGGQRCYVSRIVPTGSRAAIGQLGDLAVATIGRGAWGNNVRIKVEPAAEAVSGRKPDWFKISVLYYRNFPDPFVDPLDPNELTNPARRTPDWIEIYENQSFTPGSGNNALTTINASSQLIRVWWLAGATPARPGDQPFTQLAALGEDGGDTSSARTVLLNDFVGDRNPMPDVPPEQADLFGRGRGLQAIGDIDEVALLSIPDEVHETLDPALQTRADC